MQMLLLIQKDKLVIAAKLLANNERARQNIRQKIILIKYISFFHFGYVAVMIVMPAMQYKL